MNRREAIAALMSLPATATVTVAGVKPRDVIVVEVEEDLDQKTAERLVASLRTVWPENKCVVLGSRGAKLKVLRGE